MRIYELFFFSRKRTHAAVPEMCPAAKSEEKMHITEKTKV